MWRGCRVSCLPVLTLGAKLGAKLGTKLGTKLGAKLGDTDTYEQESKGNDAADRLKLLCANSQM